MKIFTKLTFFIGGMVFMSLITVVVTSALTPKQFSDVDQAAYYSWPVSHMNMMGVMSGYENGKFGPNDPVTRGQVATILNKYNDKMGLALANEIGGIRSMFMDQLKGKTWADYKSKYAYFPFSFDSGLAVESAVNSPSGPTYDWLKDNSVVAYDETKAGQGIQIYADKNWASKDLTDFYVKTDNDYYGDRYYGPFYDNVKKLVEEAKASK